MILAGHQASACAVGDTARCGCVERPARAFGQIDDGRRGLGHYWRFVIVQIAIRTPKNPARAGDITGIMDAQDFVIALRHPLGWSDQVQVADPQPLPVQPGKPALKAAGHVSRMRRAR